MNARPSIWFSLALILLLCACRTATPPLVYYSLSRIDSGPATPINSAHSDTLIGLGPVSLPAYLDRRQMIVRTGPHELRIDDFHMWAAPLSEELPRILAENLLLVKPSVRIARMPWGSRSAPDITVGIHISRFEAWADGRVSLAAAVTMNHRRSETNWSIQLEERAASRSHADLVAAQSRLWAEFSRRLAAALP